MAPENILQLPSDFKSDIWSLGVVLYALIDSKLPYQGLTAVEVENETVTEPLQFNGSAWVPVSNGCKDIIAKMLEKDPDARFSIEQVLNHPWLASL